MLTASVFDTAAAHWLMLILRHDTPLLAAAIAFATPPRQAAFTAGWFSPLFELSLRFCAMLTTRASEFLLSIFFFTSFTTSDFFFFHYFHIFEYCITIFAIFRLHAISLAAISSMPPFRHIFTLSFFRHRQ